MAIARRLGLALVILAVALMVIEAQKLPKTGKKDKLNDGPKGPKGPKDPKGPKGPKYGKAKKVQKRFDSFYYICPKVKQADGSTNSSYTCPPDPNPHNMCQCGFDFDQLNFHGGHYIATLGPLWLNKTRAAGNKPAFQADKINDSFPKYSGWKHAKKIIKKARKFKKAGDKVPKYVILNHVSKSRWTQRVPGYHKYVFDLLRGLKKRGMKGILMLPFMFPKGFKRTMGRLAKKGYIGVEAYLDSKAIVKLPADKRESYMKKQYEKSMSTYENKYKIPRNKIVFFEHYGTTTADKPYGRSGVSSADWISIIKMRTKIIKGLKVLGFASYGWFDNGMKVTQDERVQYYKAYNDGIQQLP